MYSKNVLEIIRNFEVPDEIFLFFIRKAKNEIRVINGSYVVK